MSRQDASHNRGWASVVRRMEDATAGPSSVLWRLRGTIGRHLSVRWKLTFWYGFMCALTLGLVGIVMRKTLDLHMQNTVHSSLKETASSMANQIGQTKGRYTNAPDCSTAFNIYVASIGRVLDQYSSSLSAPGQYERVYAGSTKGISTEYVESKALKNKVIPGSEDVKLVTGVMFGKPTFADLNQGGEHFVAYYRALPAVSPLPFDSKCQLLGALIVYQDEHNYVVIQGDLDNVLLFGIPLGLVIALVAGWWIARAALRPINRISRTVQSVGDSRDLTRRVGFIGPRDEVGRLADTFDDMMERLQSAFETQKRFVADASHELRTPLTAIRGNADLLRIAPPEEREICVTSIRREAERMSRLVNDLLLLAAADVDQQPLQMGQVYLDEIIHDVHRSALLLAADSLEIRLDAVEPVVIQGDSDRVKQLLLNLVDNAVKFTPSGGTVGLSLAREGNWARIDVSDTGVGIAAEEQEAIFRRFYRVEESRSHRGSGLGLSICAWIASAHGGTIDVRSEAGKGSVFIVRLPSCSGPEATGRALSAASTSIS